MGILADLGVDLPVLAAPMAGGPGTPALVIAAAAAGSLGFLAAGYKTADALAAEIVTVREATNRFGVNVFAPHPMRVDLAEFRAYAASIAADAQRYDVVLGDSPQEDDDLWAEKIDLLIADPVPLVSFTFALPSIAVVAELQRAGTVVVQTVTSAAEATRAVAVGVDAIAVQASVAGGHSGTLDPVEPLSPLSLPGLVGSVREAVGAPIFAGGGVATAADASAAIHAGATAVVVGTALLRTPESGATAFHRAALVDPARESVITHAFTGRPARGLRNEFIEAHEADAPYGYPALHYLTSPMRKAAAAAGDPERVNLWAGTGHRLASEEPAGDVLRSLVSDI